MSAGPSLADAAARKLAAKRANERVKLAASFLNALAVGVAGAGLIVPAIGASSDLLQPGRAVWLAAAVVLHVAGHAAFTLLKGED